MKKHTFKLLLITASFGVMAGCSKELQTITADNSASNAIGISQAQDKGMPTAHNGILHFSNEAQLSHYLTMTSSMAPEERIRLEKQLGFESLTTILDRVTEAEVKHQEEFFAGLDPDLSPDAYVQMGYRYERTPLFKQYQAQGLIKDITYADGSKAFELAIHNPAYQNAIGTAKSIQIGQTLVQFEGLNGQTVTLSAVGASAGQSTNKITLNNEYNFVKHARRPGNESWTGTVYWITDPAKGSNYRYYAYAQFSSSFTVTTLSQTYFWTARAEQKKFGNWATRNDYLPIWGISASWSYEYWVIFPGAGYGTKRDGALYPLPNNANNPTSPYSLSGMNSNFIGNRYMYPHGLYSITSSAGYQFWDNVRIYNSSYTFKFSGGCCGYDYVGQ